MEVKTVLFDHPGPENTDETLKIASEGIEIFHASRVIIASTSGRTAEKAVEIIGPEKLVVVSHAYGFYKPNEDEMDVEIRKRLSRLGVPVITAAHTFAGLDRAIRRKFNTFMTGDIVANMLRTVCEGFKVSYELACMACDAGAVNMGDVVITVAGSGEGADTAVVVKAANSHFIFDTGIIAILAKPR